MLVGIIVSISIPLVFGSLLWFTDWAESTLLAPTPLTVPAAAAPVTVMVSDQASAANPALG